MKHTRIVVTKYGGPDSLRLIEEDCPEPNAGEVRIRVLTAGVALPDVMAREGIHPETPRVPFTPGWDLVGVVDRLGAGVRGIEPGQLVAAMPISGAYAQFVCLPSTELIPVPAGLDAAEAVSLVLNYVTAYQMLHRSAAVSSGQRALIHGAAGGVGTALLQLGRNRLHGLPVFGLYIAASWMLPGRKRVIPYSIQWLKRLKPAWFREDLGALFELLRQQRIKPLVALRLPLSEARRAHELLGEGGVIGKFVLVPDETELGAHEIGGRARDRAQAVLQPIRAELGDASDPASSR